MAGEIPAGGHVVAMPYPGRGHVNPMMNHCRSLLSLHPSITVTFVLTEEWRGLLLASSPAGSLPPRLLVRTIPNVIPSERNRAADFPNFINAVFTKMEAPFEHLLDELPQPPPAAIVADTYLPWVIGVGKRRGIPVCSLFPMSTTFFDLILHFDSLLAAKSDGHAPANSFHRNPGSLQESEDDGEKCSLKPFWRGPAFLKAVDVDCLCPDRTTLEKMLHAVARAKEAAAVVFTTSSELEAAVIESLRRELPCRVFVVGPCIPFLLLPEVDDESRGGYFAWLDSKPVNSVLYVSLGSFMSVKPAQLDEISTGLVASGMSFLWVARDESSRLQQSVGAAGLVVPWCDQLKVLCHPSIGGFMSHCGWNSTLEAAYAGVPVATFPLAVDQQTNGLLMTHDWRTGISLRGGRGDEITGHEAIAGVVKRLMDPEDGSDGMEMRRRALALKEICRRAVGEGGSSRVSLSDLGKSILRNEL